MAKKVQGYIKLQIPAGGANPSPPVGPALGQQGVNIMEFCKQFNAATQKEEKGLPIPVIITVYSDRSFTFVLKTPPAAVLVRKAIGIEKGSGHAEHQEGRQDLAQAARGNREAEDARPDRRGPRRGRAHHRGQRPQHGRRRGGHLTWPPYSSARSPGLTSVKPGQAYPIDEAVAIVKEFASAKFDETVDVAINLGIDPAKSDQQVRGSTVMPNGTGKKVRVAVFTQGKNADAAREAGADIVGLEDLAEKVKAGQMDFDVVVASPDAMRVVGGLGQILGPRGLMPNPKVGTVTPDVAGAVRNAKAGQVRYRCDKAGIVHCTIGKASFKPEALKENLLALIADIQKHKPSTSKGVFLQRVSVSSTMGPGIGVDRASLG